MKAIFVSEFKCEQFDDLNDVPYEVRGYTEDLSKLREQGCWVHRAELDNQPQYTGFLGPMWDGNMLRYETQAVYDVLNR